MRRSSTNYVMKGFSLIELLVVAGLIGILATTVLYLVNPELQLQRARDAQRKADLRQIQTAMELYRSDNGVYACSVNGCGIGITDSYPTSFTALTLPVKYMEAIPQDPVFNSSLTCVDVDQTNAPYLLMTLSFGAGYTLYANLENPDDPDALRAKPTPIATASTMSFDAQNTTMTVTSGTCSGKTFNYWLNNP